MSQAEKTLACSQSAPTADVVARASRVAADGGVLVLPTDSVYGLACAATPHNPAHRRIFDIKLRDYAQTLPWFVADPEDLDRYAADVPDWARELARIWWPGALTLVVRASDAVPEEYSQAPAAPGGPRTLALRVPDSELVRAIVRELGHPLAQTSANTHGNPAATSAALLESSVAAAADLVLDAGPATRGVASTIVDACGPVPRVLREGAIPASEVLLGL